MIDISSCSFVVANLYAQCLLLQIYFLLPLNKLLVYVVQAVPQFLFAPLDTEVPLDVTDLPVSVWFYVGFAVEVHVPPADKQVVHAPLHVMPIDIDNGGIVVVKLLPKWCILVYFIQTRVDFAHGRV